MAHHVDAALVAEQRVEALTEVAEARRGDGADDRDLLVRVIVGMVDDGRDRRIRPGPWRERQQAHQSRGGSGGGLPNHPTALLGSGLYRRAGAARKRKIRDATIFS